MQTLDHLQSSRTIHIKIILVLLLTTGVFGYFISSTLRALSRTQLSAETLNSAGRLRMKLQRIAWFCNSPELRTVKGKDQLTAAVHQFENRFSQVRDTILNHQNAAFLKDDGEKLLADLNKQYDPFINTAKALAATPEQPDPEQLAIINEYAAGTLLDNLEKLVAICQRGIELYNNKIRRMLWVTLYSVLGILLLEYWFIFRPMLKRIVQDANALHQLATTDPLTGVQNRRSFSEMSDRALDLCKRYHTPLSLIAIDIDFFKKVNDTYGHDCGDEVLKKVAKEIHNSVRTSDITARMGGEEFCILCPNTDSAGAKLLADRIRERIEVLDIPYSGVPVQVTISAGVASCLDRTKDTDELLQNSDAALYAAKEGGRNRVMVFSSK